MICLGSLYHLKVTTVICFYCTPEIVVNEMTTLICLDMRPEIVVNISNDNIIYLDISPEIVVNKEQQWNDEKSQACHLCHLGPGKNEPLAHQINCHLLNFSSASIFKMLQCHSKHVLIVGEKVVWVSNSLDLDEKPSPRCLIQIQAVFIWHFSCDWQAKD